MYPAYTAVQMLRLRSVASTFNVAATRAISTNRRQRNTASAERAQSTSDRDKFLHYNAEDGYYKTSPFDPIKVPNIPLHEYVWRDFKKWENSTAAVSMKVKSEIESEMEMEMETEIETIAIQRLTRNHCSAKVPPPKSYSSYSIWIFNTNIK